MQIHKVRREYQIVIPHLTKLKNPLLYKKNANLSIESKLPACNCKSLKENKISNTYAVFIWCVRPKKDCVSISYINLNSHFTPILYYRISFIIIRQFSNPGKHMGQALLKDISEWRAGNYLEQRFTNCISSLTDLRSFSDGNLDL